MALRFEESGSILQSAGLSFVKKWENGQEFSNGTIHVLLLIERGRELVYVGWDGSPKWGVGVLELRRILSGDVGISPDLIRDAEFVRDNIDQINAMFSHDRVSETWKKVDQLRHELFSLPSSPALSSGTFSPNQGTN